MADALSAPTSEIKHVAAASYATVNGGAYTVIERARVPGGWLYITTIRIYRLKGKDSGWVDPVGVSTTFVPEVAS